MSSSSPATVFDDGQSSLRRFLKNCSDALPTMKGYSGQCKAHLVVSIYCVNWFHIDYGPGMCILVYMYTVSNHIRLYLIVLQI